MASRAPGRHAKKKPTEESRSRSSSRPPEPRQSDPSVPRTFPDAGGVTSRHDLTPVGPVEASRHVNPIFPREQNPSTPNYVAVPGGEATLARDLAEFARNTPLNDMRASSSFVRQHPSIIHASDTTLQSQYLDRAAEALARDDEASRRVAFSYMEKYSLIRLVKVNLDKDVPDLLHRRDPDMTRKFAQVFARVKGDCEAKAKRVERTAGGKERPPSGRPPVVERPTGPSMVEGITGRIDGLQLHQQRFRTLPPREWNYFRPGRVIAIRVLEEYEDQTSQQQDHYSLERVRTSRGTVITEKVRRFVVVRCREGFCIAVPINTYGGQGLKKLGFRENNINAHARIHMSDQRPAWLDGEPKTPKRDIEVIPEDQHQVLHPASRVNFERMTDVDYNAPIMKIGTVTPQTLGYLTRYFDSETARVSSQGRPRTQGSGGRGSANRENRQLETLTEENRHTAQLQGESRHAAQPPPESRHTARSQEWTREFDERQERNLDVEERRQRGRQIDEREDRRHPTQESEERSRRTDQMVQRQERSRHSDSAKDKKPSNDRGRGGRR